MSLINFTSKKNNANETGSSFCNTQSIILKNFNKFSYSREAKYMFLKLCHFFYSKLTDGSRLDSVKKFAALASTLFIINL